MRRWGLSASLLLMLLGLALFGAACHRPGGPQQPEEPVEPSAQPGDSTVGPIPDFAALDEVRWHASLEAVAPDLPPLLTRLLGPAAVQEDDGPEDDGSLIWMRDYHPMLVRRANGETTTVAYLAESQNRTKLLNRRRASGVAHVPADQIVPLIHENGNLVTNGRLVFVSERLLEDNAMEREDPALRAAGYKARSGAEVVALLAAALGRHRRDVVVLPSLPLEETQHVDVWLMFLDERTAVVPKVHREVIQRLPQPARPGARAVATFLDTQAEELSRRDLRVVRLPMLPPISVIPTDHSEDPTDTEALFLTPANGLLIAHGGKRVVVLPEFDLQDDAPDLADLQRAYELEWEAELAVHGWTVLFVDGTTLVRHLGLVRCVTAPIPRAGSERQAPTSALP